MRFILTPIGSGGDVRPFAAIGAALVARGHDAVLLAAEPFEGMAREGGLRFASIWPAVAYERETRNPALWDAAQGMKVVMRILGEQLQTLWDAVASEWAPGETVLVTHTFAFAPRAFAEKHAVPAAAVHLAPSVFRSAYEQPALPEAPDLNRLPRFLRAPLWRAIDRFMIDPMIAPALNAWRARHELPPLRRIFHDWIHAPQLVLALFPEWFATPQSDWPAQTKLVGFPLPRATAESVDAGLDAWLAAGEPPVVVTPGTANQQASEFLRTATEAAIRCRRRVLLATPWKEQTPAASDSVRSISYAPFAAMLHRCAAIVHHGGIGTCAQGLQSGVPQLVMPMAFDQPDNAERLRKLGVGASIPRKRFDIDTVAAALDRLLTSSAVATACELSRRRTADDDGIGAACHELERLGA